MNDVETLKKELKEKNIRSLALDIDDCLASTAGYWAHVIAQKYGNPENLSTKEFQIKYKFFQNIPYFQKKEILSEIENLINNDNFQDEIPAIDDSQVFVNKINSIIPLAAYITSRPKGILNGTKKWLTKHNFPNVPILIKPEEKDGIDFLKKGEWKAEIMRKLYPEVTGIIDDSMYFAKSLSKNYKGTIFLYNYDSYDEDVRNVISCPTWNDVYKNVRQRFANTV